MMVALGCCQDCAAAVGRLHEPDCPRRSAHALRARLVDCASALPPLRERLAPYGYGSGSAGAEARLRAQPSPLGALTARLLLGGLGS